MWMVVMIASHWHLDAVYLAGGKPSGSFLKLRIEARSLV